MLVGKLEDGKQFRLEVLRLEKEVRAEMLVERQKMRLMNRKQVVYEEVKRLQRRLKH